MPAELKVQKGETLFPRIDMKKELAELEAAIKASQATSVANQQKLKLFQLHFLRI